MPVRVHKHKEHLADYKEERAVNISLNEAIELVEGQAEIHEFIPAEQVFWERLGELPEEDYEERGTLYYYLLLATVKSSHLSEGEKTRSLYEKMTTVFREQEKIYARELAERPKDHLVRLQYSAFLKLMERYFFSLKQLFDEKDWADFTFLSLSEKMHYLKRRLWFEQRWFEWFFYKFIELSAGYGYSFWRWGFTTFAIVLLFGYFFWFFDTVQTDNAMADGVQGMGNYIYYSVVTFSTLGYGDITPVTYLEKFLAATETVTGYLMLGVLMALLQRRME